MRSYWIALKPVLTYFLPLLKKYGKADVSQILYLQTLDEYGISHGYCGAIVGQILSAMYQADIITEDNILKWYENPPNDPLAMGSVRKHVSNFFFFTYFFLSSFRIFIILFLKLGPEFHYMVGGSRF